jgi:hypothetical protein
MEALPMQSAQQWLKGNESPVKIKPMRHMRWRKDAAGSEWLNEVVN